MDQSVTPVIDRSAYAIIYDSLSMKKGSLQLLSNILSIEELVHILTFLLCIMYSIFIALKGLFTDLHEGSTIPSPAKEYGLF